MYPTLSQTITAGIGCKSQTSTEDTSTKASTVGKIQLRKQNAGIDNTAQAMVKATSSSHTGMQETDSELERVVRRNKIWIYC